MIFETDYTRSNNIMFKIQSGISLENQMYFSGQMGLFGVQAPVNISITNSEYSFTMNGTIFNSKYSFGMEVAAPYEESLLNALFTVNAEFPDK